MFIDLARRGLLIAYTRNAPVTQEIGRIGKNHVELKTERRQQLECVAVKKGKIVIIGLIHTLIIFISVQISEMKTTKNGKDQSFIFVMIFDHYKNLQTS